MEKQTLTKNECVALANYGVELENELEARADFEAKIEFESNKGENNE